MKEVRMAMTYAAFLDQMNIAAICKEGVDGILKPLTPEGVKEQLIKLRYPFARWGEIV